MTSDNLSNKNFTEEEKELIQCYGCPKKFSIKSIRKHLGHQPSCKKKYSEEQILELERICNSHRYGKLSITGAILKKKKKKQVNEPCIFVCKNPYCKSKRKRQKFNPSGLLKHLANHEICEGYFAPSEIKDLESKSINQDAIIKSEKKKSKISVY